MYKPANTGNEWRTFEWAPPTNGEHKMADSSAQILLESEVAKIVIGDFISDAALPEELADSIIDASKKFNTVISANGEIVGKKSQERLYIEFLDGAVKKVMPSLINQDSGVYNRIEEIAASVETLGKTTAAELLVQALGKKDNGYHIAPIIKRERIAKRGMQDVYLEVVMKRVPANRYKGRPETAPPWTNVCNVRAAYVTPASITPIEIGQVHIPPEIEKVADFVGLYANNCAIFWCYNGLALLLVRRLLGDSI